MAIDDNKLYGLTGAQIKELPGKIEDVKGQARVLTTDDYNANRNNWDDTDPTHFNTVALWKLPLGVYWAPDGVMVNASRNHVSSYGHFYIVGRGQSSLNIFRWWSSDRIEMISCLLNGSADSLTTILPSSEVKNNLTSTSGVLSANQGKVLKGLVDSLAIRGAGAPTTTTAGQVGTLYEDITNGDLYICTDATDPYVWEEVGAGGGGGTSGMKQLTTSDYNWPENNPDGIAPWLLDLGWYITSDNLKIYPSSTTGSYYTSIYGQVYCIGRGNGMGSGQRFVFNLGSGAGIPATQWSGATYTR